jgi:hypothetical protein
VVLCTGDYGIRRCFEGFPQSFQIGGGMGSLSWRVSGFVIGLSKSSSTIRGCCCCADMRDTKSDERKMMLMECLLHFIVSEGW